MLIRALLASTPNESPDASRRALDAFALRKGQRIGAYYNEPLKTKGRASLFQLLRQKGLAIASGAQSPSGADRSPRSELDRLIQDARPNDVLLLERAQMLQDLARDDWQGFRQKLRQRKVRVVALDVESSWSMMSGESGMAQMAEQMTGVLLDMLDTQASGATGTHRQRQLAGIARAKAQGKYKGRPVDQEKHQRIIDLLASGHSWSEVCQKAGVSRSTIARVVKANP